MKELNDLFTWVSSYTRPDPQLSSLTEWLELEQRDAVRRGSRVFAVRFLSFFGFIFGLFIAAGLGAAIGLKQIMHGETSAAVTAAIGTCAVAVGLGVLFGRVISRFALSRREPLKSDRSADALRAIAHLRQINGYQNHRGLRRELGDHGVLELNEGTQLYLRCHSLLTSEAWTSRSDEDPWAEARDGMLAAMQGAMDRLALFVVRKRSFGEIGPVLEEMRMATNEAERITVQRSHSAGSEGRDLRASLQRMKELADAEQELLRARS